MEGYFLGFLLKQYGKMNMIEKIKEHMTKILIGICILGMVLAPDGTSFAVMLLVLFAVLIKAGGHSLNDRLTKWWISGKWK